MHCNGDDDSDGDGNGDDDDYGDSDYQLAIIEVYRDSQKWLHDIWTALY